MKSGTAFKNFPTGTKAVLAWSAFYTIVILVICILFIDVKVDGYSGIIPSMDTGLSKGATIAFYVIVYGGFVISWLIGCRVQVNIEEATENGVRRRYFRLAWFDIPILIAMILTYVLLRDYLIGVALMSWFFMTDNPCWLWKFRKELGLA